MAKKRYWLGNVGPLLYDDVVPYPYDGTPAWAFRTDGQVRVDAAPSMGTHVLRKDDMDGLLQTLAVADIDDPSAELSGLAGTAVGSLVVVYASLPDADFYTVYGWDTAVGAGEAIPYVVAGDGGFWVAIAGRYSASHASWAGNLAANRGLFTQTTGTSPLAVSSTTVCTNLNADMCDGQHLGTGDSPSFLDLSVSKIKTDNFFNAANDAVITIADSLGGGIIDHVFWGGDHASAGMILVSNNNIRAMLDVGNNNASSSFAIWSNGNSVGAADHLWEVNDLGMIFNEEALDKDVRFESVSNANCFFMDGGNSRIGINNGSPSAALDVTGSFRLSGSITVSDDQWIGLGAAAGRIEFDNQSTDEINLLDCRVGVGTTDPRGKLHVVNGSANTLPTIGTFGGAVAIGGDSINYGLEIGTLNTGQTYLQAHRFDGTTTAYNLGLQPSGGNVGIGTVSAGALLDVRGTVIFNEDGGDFDVRFEGDTDANLFFLDASTNRIGIGSNSPTTKLHVVGDATVSQDLIANRVKSSTFVIVSGTPYFTADGNGNVNLPLQAGASVYASSTSQTLGSSGSGSIEKITFNTERYDVGSRFNSSTFTANCTGRYYVSANITFDGSDLAAGERVRAHIYVNGASVLAGAWAKADGTSEAIGASVHGIVSVTSGQTIEIYGQHTSATATDIQSSAANDTWAVFQLIA